MLGWVPAPAVPHRHSSYGSLRLPCVLRPRLRFPSLSAYPEVSGFSYPPPSCHPLTMGRSRFHPRAGSRLPLPPPGKRQGPPRLLDHPLVTCRSRTPRPDPPRLALSSPLRYRLQLNRQLGRPELSFSRLNTPAHNLACLRIACAVIATGARLATDLPGSALVGSVSHRLDDDSEFQGSIAPPFPSDQPCLVAPALCSWICICCWIWICICCWIWI